MKNFLDPRYIIIHYIYFFIFFIFVYVYVCAIISCVSFFFFIRIETLDNPFIKGFYEKSFGSPLLSIISIFLYFLYLCIFVRVQ